MAKFDKKLTDYRASGVLLHITSLPNDYNTLGVFSDNCIKFIDWLAEGGFKIWQVLPINDCGYYYSPYSAISTYAVNPYLIDLSKFLSIAEIESFGFDKEGDRLVEENKIDQALDLIYDKFGKTTDKTEFVKANKSWLDDYACFKVLKKIYKDTPWTGFPTELKNRDKVILDKFKIKHAKEIDKIKFIQYIANTQWQEIKSYANSKGIKVFGDMPFYIELDSADVWANPKNWKLDANGKGDKAGVPPDYFNSEGQLWGNPIYNYTAMAKNNYSFFVKRFQRLAELFDILRIDHFIAFNKYWVVPANSNTAKNGKWVKGYGDAILKQITTKVNVEIIAEDLGILTPEATALKDKFNLPGLKVLQFAFDEADEDNAYQPHNYEKNCVAYIGTHDNDTFMGLLNNSDWDKINRFKNYLRIPLHWGNDAVVDNSIIALYRSSANKVIFTMQDILKFGTDCRMNIPGTIKGNWGWQLKELPSKDLCGWYKELSRLYFR